MRITDRNSDGLTIRSQVDANTILHCRVRVMGGMLICRELWGWLIEHNAPGEWMVKR